MLPKLKPIFSQRKYLLIFLGTSLASFALFLLLTLLFPWSSFLFFNYFLKEALGYAVLTFITVMLFSLVLGVMAGYVAYAYKNIVDKKLFVFLGILGILYIASYILMLANTSYSLFSYTEMNGFLYTFANFLLLAPIMLLSSLLLVNAYVTFKNAKTTASGIGGLTAGLFSMGCPSCGALLYSLIGITAGLTVLPFRGLELKLFSLGLLGFAVRKLSSRTCSLPVETVVNEPGFFAQKHENIALVALFLAAGLIFFNQMQISGIYSSLDGMTGAVARGGNFFSSGKQDLSGVDVSGITSTPMAVATVFPELKDAKNEQDVMDIMLASGPPEYSEVLGGITFDDVALSKTYLAKLYYSLKEDIKENDPEVWQRYLNLAAAPRGVSCEFCCGVGPQGVDENGRLRCGCAHNVGLQALTMALMKYTDYSDAQVLREVMKWKASFFPRDMVAIGIEVAGQDPSQLKDLPGMVGGC